MTSIVKKDIPAKALEVINQSEADIEIGAMYIRDTDIRIIDKVTHKSSGAEDSNYDVTIYYREAIDWELTKWSKVSSTSLHQWLYYKYTKLKKTFAEYREESLKVLNGEKLPTDYQDTNDSINNEMSLIGRASKEVLQHIQSELEAKKQHTDLVHKFIKYEMEKRRQDLEKIRSSFEVVLKDFYKKIEKIQRVVISIELYLGISEELHQIKSGEKADLNTPISFRQRVLFIDEEVAAYEDGGLDFRDIEKFDEWLIHGKNIDILLPEQKGIVVLRPRRKDKEYHDNYLNVVFNAANSSHTYILIRNGENVYRIYTEKLVIHDRLFPLRNEMHSLMAKMEKAHFDSEKEEIESSIHGFKKRAMLLQGLIDRTEIFHPLPVDRINIFKLDEFEGMVNFIYDDEASLPSGRLSFKQWIDEINSKIQQGSRILHTGVYDYWRKDDYSDRFYLAKNSSEGLKNVPDLPQEGVYEVEKFRGSHTCQYRETEYLKHIKELQSSGRPFKDLGAINNGKTWRTPDAKTGSKKIYGIRFFDENEELTIMYKPESEATSGWNRWNTHDRKSRARFKIYRDDNFVINYDQVSLEDIEFYLHSRVDRPNYLSLIPLLKKLKKFLIEEKKKEEQFIRLVYDTTFSKLDIDEKALYSRIYKAVDWWKFKNQWKRSIDKDDTLALRMIRKRILSQK